MGTIRDEARQPPTIPPFPPPTDVESRRVPPVGQQEKVDVDSRNVETERLCNNSHHQDSSICNRDEEDNSAQSQPLLEHIIQQGSRPMQSDLPLDFVGNPFLDDEQLEKAMKSSKQQQFWNYANRNRRQYERVQTVADEEIDVEMQCYPRRYKKVRFSAGSNCILHPDMRYPLYSESDLIKITENEEALSNIRNSARSATKNLMQSMRANKELTAYDDGEELQGEKKREAHRDRLLKKLQRMDNLMRQSGYGIEKVSIDSKDENAVIRFLLSRRVYGYPDTDGTVLSNYFSYLLNNHPFLSLWFMHPKHPFNRKSRLIVFLCSLAFTICASFVVKYTDYIYYIAVCREGCNEQFILLFPGNSSINSTSDLLSMDQLQSQSYFNSLDSLNGTTRNYTVNAHFSRCAGGFNDGMSHDRYDDLCPFYRPWMLSAIAGAMTVLYGSILKFFATCGCVQGRAIFQNNCCGSWIKRIVESLGGRALAVCCVVSLSLLVATIVELELRNIEYSLLSTILFSKVWSFFEWMLYTAPYFSYRYPLDKKSFYRQHQADLKAAENVPARQTAKQKTQNKSKSSKVRSVPERKV